MLLTVLNFLFIISLSFFIYWLAPKVHIDPKYYPFGIDKNVFSPSLDVEHILWNNVSRKFHEKFVGPASITHNPDTGEIYTGTSDGMIWKISKELTSCEPIIRIGDYHKDCGLEVVEEICGRVLGLKYLTGNKLIVVDAYKGIIAIHLNKLSKQVLIRPDQNMLTRSLKMFNSIDVSKNGILYFTVTSMKWSLKNHVYSILEAESTGRVYCFNLLSGDIELIASDLSLAKGVTLTYDEKNLIVSEFFRRRLIKINLSNTNERSTVFLENLPGFPVNIKKDNFDSYYFTISFSRSMSFLAYINEHPWISHSMAWLLPKWVITFILYGESQVYKINDQGNVVSIISGSLPGTEFTTEANKINGKIFFGNLANSYMDILDLSQI